MGQCESGQGERQGGSERAARGRGKRVRPLLVYAAGQLGDAKPEMLDCAAVAIECIHAYSLVYLLQVLLQVLWLVTQLSWLLAQLL